MKRSVMVVVMLALIGFRATTQGGDEAWGLREVTAGEYVAAVHNFNQIENMSFPNIEEYETVDVDLNSLDFTISNDALFTFGCGNMSITCGVWDRTSDQTTLLAKSDGLATYWSIDNSQVITTNENQTCDINAGKYNVTIFHTLSNTVSYDCLPSSPIIFNWSPLDPSIASVFLDQNYLLDTTNFQLTSYTPPTILSETDLPHLVGYNQYLWDSNTGLPIARLKPMQQLSPGGEITQSILQACTYNGEQCIDLLDTLDVTNATPFDERLNGRWLLWGTHESETGEANQDALLSPLDRSDTVLYLTDLFTAESRELFRFSSLNRDDVFAKDFAWSPDGKTIAISLDSYDQTITMAGQVINHPLGGTPSVLLIKLNWLTG